ncbi:FAD-dependent monooxygenase [Sphingobium sp. SJ10-10]|uniref:FAD-dependent monooxygenase n=1 Tax=Sphingobium sp. SJ10-10 TaxID=3114999 RepID=UPI002E1843A0|nr:FAD-dependent monooxygenase [Sphingobium sp. SJ10-10]
MMEAAGAEKYQVLVAGAGPVGMCTAIDLALRGVSVFICEPRAPDQYGVGKVNLTNARSMEHFRRWGIADRLRANDPIPSTVIRDLTMSTRANGFIIFNAVGGNEWREPMPIASEKPEWAPFQAIEKTLRERVLELPNITFSSFSSAVDFVQDEKGVELTYEKDGQTKTVSGQYLVVADGPYSSLRRKINLRLEGETIFRNFSWYFRAPELSKLFEKTQLSSHTFFLNDDAYGDLLAPQSENDHWVYMVSPTPEGVDPKDWDTVKKMLFRSVGQEFETSEEQGWEWGSHARMTRTFNFGRAFLAGDAAHLTPPFGGFGMNMGVGDAADLGWKISAMLDGWGGPQLLESYTLERREVCKFIIEGSVHNNRLWGKALVKEYMEEDSERGEQVRAEVRDVIIKEKTQQFKSLGAQFGYRYTGSPIIVGDGSELPPLHYGDYIPTSIPGYRAPHVWLQKEDSLYDHFGTGFCLLVLCAEVDTAPLEAAADDAGLPLKVWRLDNADVRAQYDRKLTLIRPDQHVAWRGDALPDDCRHLVDVVRGAAQYR